MEDFEILFVDDEVEILDTVGEYLSQEGYKATLSDDGLKALGLVKERRFDVVFTDLKMPEFDGLELLAAIKEHRPETEVIIVTGYGTIESAIMAMKFGSYDYIQKPIKLDQLKMLCDKIMAEKKLKDENIFLKKSLKQRNRYEGLIGISPKMQETYEIIERIGQSSPSVLIQGEKGTGKELVARAIHKRSDRADKPFVPVNCSAIVEGSPESELFDHVTDLFDAAKGGTIFLDEVA
nr:sigma-54-dependent Fis family transcriptional regulator [Deltaproteobacteria bacterium]